ncbi:MAG: peroxide stress protein YaaA [Legionellales bacterium]
MLTLLSPAKKLLAINKPYTQNTTLPQFDSKTLELVSLMKSKTKEDIAGLMSLSQALATLNFDRYQEFVLQDPQLSQTYPALLLFQGDVYQSLQAACWDNTSIEYSQCHLAILSGLYGLLRPLDRIQPYRLEMGVRLANPCGNNLYNFWQTSITSALNQQLAEHDNPVLINLASTEYFKAVDEKKINYPTVTINFYEKKNTELKMIGIHAKKARGAMARFLMRNQIDDLETLKTFTDLGYRFNHDSLSERHIDFVR